MAIRILPELLSNKIAAGEVIERPASVVKELIENSLDAGSTRIMIDIENGGRNLIQISDNGCGMSRDDALLSIERFATSKIYKEDDLFSIRTLGFRGEALPSIAAVSQFTIETRNAESDIGTRIEMAGGKIKAVLDVGAPIGTLVSVKNLFYNVAARRKFLKSVQTEMSRIADTVESIALGWPHVHFRLSHNGKIVKDWYITSNVSERIIDVLGSDIRQNLVMIESEDKGMVLRGGIVHPNITRTTARNIYIFVNGRYVRDRVIQHAIIDGFGNRLMKGQFPLAVLFYQIDPDKVDVNVHPTKQEIRFSEPQMVHRFVSSAVSQALNRSEPKKWEVPNKITVNPSVILEHHLEFANTQKDIPKKETISVSSVSSDQYPSYNVAPNKEFHQESLWIKKKLFQDARIIGQVLGTYILCDSDEGLIIIDQHAAHERILYETMSKNSQSHHQHTQQLLVPETIELSFTGSDVLNKLKDSFYRVGLEIEPFGRNTFVVKTVPLWLSSRNISDFIHQVIDNILEIGIKPDIDQTMDDCLKVMACHGAIRSGQILNNDEMRKLLKELDDCAIPSYCPHGRPTWIKWTHQFLEKSFKRIP